MGAIVVENVSKRFRLQTDRAHSIKELFTRRGRDSDIDHFWALKDVSLTIPEGSMYALVGHNGCGKSTLLRLMANIYRPTEGRVKATGRISTLLELGAGFHPDLTGRENVYMNATILGMSKSQIDKVFDEIVDFAGVGEFIDSPVKVYSSGMYVRLGFSVAVHVDPEILIIDEVIAVGDEEFQRRCFDHMYELRKRGVTIVVVTHGMDTVSSMCDKAAWLDHGELQLEGPAREVAGAYLDQVNQKEAEQRAQAHLVRAEDPDAGLELGKDIAITDVWFSDPASGRTDTVTSGSDTALHVRFETRGEVDEPVVGYGIHTENGVHVAGSNTKVDGCSMGTVSGTREVTFSMDNLELLPGNYEFTVAINDKFAQHVFDRHVRKHPLAVRRGPNGGKVGLVDLRGDWTVEVR